MLGFPARRAGGRLGGAPQVPRYPPGRRRHALQHAPLPDARTRQVGFITNRIWLGTILEFV